MTNHRHENIQPVERRIGPDQYNRGLYWLALLTAAATLLLIFMGGLVTAHGAGLSVPDWPNSFGYNMWLFPPSQWVGGIFYEHTHRLMGTLVGFLSMLLAGWALWSEKRGLRLWLTLIVLGGVIFQGILGGLRVIWTNLDLAIIHACVAQAFFCLTAAMVMVSSREGIREGTEARRHGGIRGVREEGGGRVLFWLAGLAVFVIYLQLIAGAMMRHYGAGLAIPDLPLAYGRWLPPMTPQQLAADNAWRAFTLHLDPTTLWQVWMHFAHRVGAVLVTLVLCITIAHTWIRHRHEGSLRRPATLLLILLIVQITLGVLTVIYRLPADIASAHVANGALVLVTSFILMMRTGRLYAGAWRINSGRVRFADPSTMAVRGADPTRTP